MNKISASIPKSRTSIAINLTGIAAYLITLYFLHHYQTTAFTGAIISICVLAGTILILERVFLNKDLSRSSGINFSNPSPVNWKRLGIKLLGLYFTLGFVALFYWLLPVYRSSFYHNYFKLTYILLPIITIGSIPYFIILDKYMIEPRDSHWHVGMFLLGKWKGLDKFAIKYHFLGWLVKAFFLALMFPYLLNNTNNIIINSFTGPSEHFGKFYDYMYNLIFSIDLAFVSAGYLLTLKIFDTHIRTAEPTFLGWMFALYCYEPFWSALANPKYLNYEDGYYWGHLFAGHQGIYAFWGTIILLLFVIFMLSSAAFGMRFSNLTNRGIITNGPYRFMKHPAYVSKNIAWWLISVPFISAAGTTMALRHCLLLLGLNLIYYLRAVTEERHLSLDPTYVQYATALNDKGFFKGLYKIFPFLKYNVNRYVQDGKIKKMLF